MSTDSVDDSSYTYDDSGDYTVSGGGGDDTISGGGGDNTVVGGAGDDTVNDDIKYFDWDSFYRDYANANIYKPENSPTEQDVKDYMERGTSSNPFLTNITKQLFYIILFYLILI